MSTGERLCLSCLFSPVQSLSHVRLFMTPWTAARQASLFITDSQGLLKLMSIESVMPSNHLIFCHPLLLPPSVFDHRKSSLENLQWLPSMISLRLVLPDFWSQSLDSFPVTF